MSVCATHQTILHRFTHTHACSMYRWCVHAGRSALVSHFLSQLNSHTESACEAQGHDCPSLQHCCGLVGWGGGGALVQSWHIVPICTNHTHPHPSIHIQSEKIRFHKSVLSSLYLVCFLSSSSCQIFLHFPGSTEILLLPEIVLVCFFPFLYTVDVRLFVPSWDFLQTMISHTHTHAHTHIHPILVRPFIDQKQFPDPNQIVTITINPLALTWALNQVLTLKQPLQVHPSSVIIIHSNLREWTSTIKKGFVY